MPNESALDTQISVSNNVIDVTMGGVRATVPVTQLEATIRVLEAMRLIVDIPTQPAAAAPAVEAPAPEPMAVAPTPVAKAVAPAPPTPTPARRAAKKPTRKRRSRKRVGDALITWMEKNPGWHTEDDLLAAVIEHKMSDANPKRALKIALGKQRDKVFVGDDRGNWKLANDDAAAPGAPKRRKKTPARTKATKAKAAERTVTAPKARKRSRRLRAKPRTASTDDSSSSESSPSAAAAAAAAADAEAKGRVIRVKPGEDRKSASFAEGEQEARERAAAKLAGRTRSRWKRVTTDEVERARKNLLGLGPTAPKVQRPIEE